MVPAPAAGKRRTLGGAQGHDVTIGLIALAERITWKATAAMERGSP